MRTYKTLVSIITFTLLVCLSACDSETDQIWGEGECLGNFETFAYYVSEQSDKLLDAEVLPLPPWEIESRLPGFRRKDGKISEGVSIIRSSQGRDEIWVSRSTWSGRYYWEGGFRNEILIYHSESGKWERTKIVSEIEDTGVYTGPWYETSDGSLWSKTLLNTKLEGQLDYIPMFSQFNEETQRFEFAPESPTFPKIEDVWRFYDWPIILLDQEDIFWIFIPKDAIYSYDTETYETKKHTLITDIDVQDVVLAPDGSFYFRKTLYGSPSLEEEEIFRFFPDSGEIIPIVPPHEKWPDGSIFIDNAGNLWFGALGYRTPEDSWHLLHPDPEGYIKNVIGGSGYRWYTPKLIFESTNGVLWFHKWSDATGDFGMAWYSTNTGEGCWFTTYAETRNLSEDSHQNLWLIIEGNLYKYALEP